MCEKCADLVATLVVEQLTDELIFAEREAGLSPKNAVRPLHEHEHDAKVRFGDLENDLDTAINDVAEVVEKTHLSLLEQILAFIFGTKTSVTPMDAMERLTELQDNTPAKVRKILADATLAVQAVLLAQFQAASARVHEEYVRQGGKLPVPGVDLGSRVGGLSRPPVARAWTWINQKTQEHFAQPEVMLGGPVTRDALLDELVTKIKPDGAIDQARQSVNATTGLARIETAEDLEPSDIYASELLDGNTCPACAAVDGTKYEDMEQAKIEYGFGYYGACRGGARCRGTLVFLYNMAGN